jgi:hypothetical protein
VSFIAQHASTGSVFAARQDGYSVASRERPRPISTTCVTSLVSDDGGQPGEEIHLRAEQLVPVSDCKACRMLSIFRQNTSPMAKPISVPSTPIQAPHSRKIRMMAPLLAPMVRRMAMSRPLSFTSMISEEMMLKAATTMISVRIRNITFRSTCTAAKKLLLLACQSSTRNGMGESTPEISRVTCRT